MPLLVRAMAARITAARVTPGEGPGQEIGGDGEKAEHLKLALPKVCGLRASWFFFHIVAILLQVTVQMQVIPERENRTCFFTASAWRRNRYLSGWI